MMKIAITVFALVAATTVALAGGLESYDGSQRKGQIILKMGTPKSVTTSPLAIGSERTFKSNYEILIDKANADHSGGPDGGGVNN